MAVIRYITVSEVNQLIGLLETNCKEQAIRFINHQLSLEQQADLLLLVWAGRGDGITDEQIEFDYALDTARNDQYPSIGDNLVRKSYLADYLRKSINLI